MAKELVSGQFGLRVAITEKVVEPTNSDFLRFLASGVMRAAATAAHAAVGDPVGADLAKLPLTYLAGVTEKSKTKKLNTIASGIIDMETDPPAESQEDGNGKGCPEDGTRRLRPAEGQGLSPNQQAPPGVEGTRSLRECDV